MDTIITKITLIEYRGGLMDGAELGDMTLEDAQNAYHEACAERIRRYYPGVEVETELRLGLGNTQIVVTFAGGSAEDNYHAEQDCQETVQRACEDVWSEGGFWGESELYDLWYEAVENGATVYRVIEDDGTSLDGEPENRGNAQVLQRSDGRWLYVDDSNGYDWIEEETIDSWRSGRYSSTLEEMPKSDA